MYPDDSPRLLVLPVEKPWEQYALAAVFNLDDVVSVGVDFIHQARNVPFVGLGVHGGVSTLVVRQAANVDAVPIPSLDHRRNVAILSLDAVTEDAEMVWF